MFVKELFSDSFLFQCGDRLDSLKYVQPVQVVPIGDPVPALTLDQQYIPSFTYSNKRSSLSAPKSSYGAPSSSYGASSPSYGAPSQSYGAPSPSYGAPSPSYGAPSPSYGAPSPSYGAPSPSYGAPSSSYGAPKARPGYKTPSTSSSYRAPAVGSTYSAPSPGYSLGSVSSSKASIGATQSFGSGSSNSNGFNQELSSSFTSQTRSVREGRIDECYCVSAALCPRNLVVGVQNLVPGALNLAPGALNRDYGSLIDPRVKNTNSNISAEGNTEE